MRETLKDTLAWGFIAVLGAAFVGVAAVPATVSALDTTSAKTVATWTVEVKVSDGSGSGTVIGHESAPLAGVRNSLILTAAHVVTLDATRKPDAHPVIVRNGVSYPGRLVAIDPALDLAAVEVDQDWPAASLYTGKINVGDPELVAGFPLGRKLALTQGYWGAETTATIAGAKREERQASASMWPGNSGGGAYVHTWGGWKLAAVADALAVYGGAFPAVANTVGYLLPASTIVRFLRENNL